MANLKVLENLEMIYKGEGVPPFAGHELLEDKEEVPPLSQQGAT